MILNRERGGYYLGQIVRLGGSFVINGTSDPVVIRDGNSNAILSVTRASAGLFTVKFLGADNATADQRFPIPSLPITWNIQLSQAAVPAQACEARLVKNSWSQSNRQFQIQCVDFEVPSAVDPDNGDVIAFEFVGCIDSSGTDPA